jgi:hypothetical protein
MAYAEDEPEEESKTLMFNGRFIRDVSRILSPRGRFHF